MSGSHALGTTFTRRPLFPALVLISTLELTACTVIPQTVLIEPTVNARPLKIEERREIAVYVVDERPTTEIGRRGTGAMRGAAITTEQDLARVFSDSIVSSLEETGFSAIPVDDDSPVAGATLLRIDIRNLEYDTSMGFWTGGVHTRGAMKVIATRGAAKYEEMYRVDDEKRVVFAPGADANAERVNISASALLQELFDDVALFEFLTE